MQSLYISRLSESSREQLESSLYEVQRRNCFICGDFIDLDVHKIEIDHVEPLKVGGKDQPENFAVTHDWCNRSKLASDPRVARVLARFDKLSNTSGEPPNLGHVLKEYDGARYAWAVSDSGTGLRATFSELGRTEITQYPTNEDKLSGFRHAFVHFPIEYLHHDDRINPRPIGRNLRRLVEEFHKGLPQLHVALGWIDPEDDSKVRIFDGQHKAAAQILLGVRELPVRVFLSPDKDKLLTANTRAGTTLRQIAFDKSIQRRLGSALLDDRISRYKRDKGFPEDYEEFSEKALCDHFRGEAKEMKRYVLDAVRDAVTRHSDNKLSDYIEYGGRSYQRPFSYTTVEKSFYSLFLGQSMLETPFNYRADEGQNPRELEINQLVRLMSMIADKIYADKFDPDRGTRRIEYQIQKG